HRLAEGSVCDPVGAIGAGGEIAARELVLALRARLHTGKAALDRKVDGLIVAAFKMQEGVMLYRAPVASVKRIAADEVQRTGDIAPVAPGHDEKRIIRHALADQAEKFAGKIGRAPFACARIHVEGVEGIPMIFCEIAAGYPFDLDAVFQCLLALLADHLALA